MKCDLMSVVTNFRCNFKSEKLDYLFSNYTDDLLYFQKHGRPTWNRRLMQLQKNIELR